jgi:hypothetical protein
MELTLETIHEKMRAYLAGEIDVDDFDDWVDDQPRLPIFERATRVQIGPNSWKVVAYGNPADDLFCEISLMFCEMSCSGCYLKEPEFRQRIQDLLNGSPCSEIAIPSPNQIWKG